MLVIKLIVAVATIGLFAFCISKFNQHCTGKFGHAFFSKGAFFITTAALGMLIVGNMWHNSAIQQHGDTLNGIMVMAIGVLLACCLVYANIRKTNAVYGIGGSIVQLGLFSLLAWISLPFIVFGLACQFFLLLTAKHVYVVNR